MLTWSAVNSTADGLPTTVSHYLVFAFDTPFSREDVRDGVVSPLASVQSLSFELQPPQQSRYYSILAVDDRGNVSPF